MCPVAAAGTSPGAVCHLGHLALAPPFGCIISATLGARTLGIDLMAAVCLILAFGTYALCLLGLCVDVVEPMLCARGGFSLSPGQGETVPPPRRRRKRPTKPTTQQTFQKLSPKLQKFTKSLPKVAPRLPKGSKKIPKSYQKAPQKASRNES